MKIESGSGGGMAIFWGQSMVSYDEAVKEAVKAAKAALPQATLEWFETIEFRGGFVDGAAQFQTAIRVGFV